MPTCTFTSQIPVKLVSANASDEWVVASARVSTLGIDSVLPEKAYEHERLINFLVKNRHGSPFEHNQFIFVVRAPIFVWREHMRHRIGFSYNEESGRYKTLEPVFYIPGEMRKMVQVGKPGAYTFEASSMEQHDMVTYIMSQACDEAYQDYESLLQKGIAREVARMVLPVNIFSTAYVTMNARSLMNFLSLRTHAENSTFPSFPMAEIEMVAEQYEVEFARLMPLTHAAFCNNGRVAP